MVEGFPDGKHGGEGRMITCEYDGFYLVNVYVPNAKNNLARLEYRYESWDPDLRNYLVQLEKKKPVILCGDLNVAHQEIDLANPSSNRDNAGFTDEEREGFSNLLAEGFLDTYRHLHPDQTGAYSWWSYRAGARSRNVGWRIDYFVVSGSLATSVREATIHSQIEGSDHCPVGTYACPGIVVKTLRVKESEKKAFFERTLVLARKGWGNTHPNPMVGALIIEDGKIVAEGYHSQAGSPHAEVEAMKSLGRTKRYCIDLRIP